MSFRNTALLAVIVALFGAYLYWIERPASLQELQSNRLLEFEPDTVDRLALTSKGETIEASRIDGVWRITSPVEAPADGRAVDTLIRTAAEAEQTRTIEPEDGDLEQFGLAEPEAVLELHSGGTALPRLAIGKGTPIGFSAYVRRGDENLVLLTGGTVRAALVKTLADLREKNILRLDEDDISRVVIRPREGPEVEIVREADSGSGIDGVRWRIVAPTEATAAEGALSGFFGALSALRAVDFLAERGADAEAGRGLVPPAYELELTGPDGKPTVVRIGNEVDVGDKTLVALTVAGDPQIYLVASHVPASLGKSANDLRDKTVLPIPAGAATELRVRPKSGEAFVLSLVGDGWTVSGEAPTDPIAAKRFVDDVLGLEGSDIAAEDAVGLAAVGVSEPDVTVEVFDGEGSSLGMILIARVEDGDSQAYYATVAGEPVVYTLRDFVYTRVTKPRGDLLEDG